MNPQNYLLCAIKGLGLYIFVILVVAFYHGKMFIGRYGRSHRLTGLIFLCIVSLGIADLQLGSHVFVNSLVFDISLSTCGILLALTAAADFKLAHSEHHVKNLASGALSESATVTVSEMKEHTFYQIMNLVQIIFLHLLGTLHDVRDGANIGARLLAMCAVTFPWTTRKFFPVNSFSSNYNQPGVDPLSLIAIMYRIKKYQYLFYKHFLLHGLNVSVALCANGGRPIVRELFFRTYWIGLNTAYVMEFFMQSLVKRRYVTQRFMLGMNIFLMAVTTVAAIPVVSQVCIPLAMASWALNILNRNQELINVAIVTGIAIIIC